MALFWAVPGKQLGRVKAEQKRGFCPDIKCACPWGKESIVGRVPGQASGRAGFHPWQPIGPPPKPCHDGPLECRARSEPRVLLGVIQK